MGVSPHCAQHMYERLMLSGRHLCVRACDSAVHKLFAYTALQEELPFWLLRNAPGQ